MQPVGLGAEHNRCGNVTSGFFQRPSGGAFWSDLTIVESVDDEYVGSAKGKRPTHSKARWPTPVEVIAIGLTTQEAVSSGPRVWEHGALKVRCGFRDHSDLESAAGHEATPFPLGHSFFGGLTMKLGKSLLLGSAAALAATVGAQAADLPVRKAAPVDYVRVCDWTGVGFFYIPGTDTCIQIGGLRPRRGRVHQPGPAVLPDADSFRRPVP